MAHLAAHAVAPHAAAKQGAAGTHASAHAGASGFDAIFAALLAAANGNANGAAATSKTDALAALLNGSAKDAITASGGKAANRNATDALLAAINAKQAGDAAAVIAKAGTQQNSKEPDASATQKPATKNGASAKTAAQADQHAASKADHNKQAPNPAAIAASVASPNAAFHRESTQAGDAAAKAQPGAKPSNVNADLAALRALAQHAAQTAEAQKTAAAQHEAVDAKAQPQANADTKSSELAHALASLQTDRHTDAKTSAAAKDAGNAHQAATKSAAAFAAAAHSTAHRDTPAQQTTSSISAAVDGAQKAHGAQADTGGAGTGHHNGSAKGQDAQANAAAKPAAPGPAHPQSAMTVHTASTAPAPAAGAQGGAGVQPGQAPITAHLQVAAQSAQPAVNPQGVPLSDLGAIAVHVAAQSKNGAKAFNIALHPADLGHIHVQLTVDHTGTAQAHLSAENPQTLSLLQRDAQSLERALKDAGVNLTGGGLNFSLKGQDRQNGNGAQTNGRARGRSLSISAVAGPAAPQAASTAAYNLAPGQVRLDIRV